MAEPVDEKRFARIRSRVSGAVARYSLSRRAGDYERAIDTAADDVGSRERGAKVVDALLGRGGQKTRAAAGRILRDAAKPDAGPAPKAGGGKAAPASGDLPLHPAYAVGLKSALESGKLPAKESAEVRDMLAKDTARFHSTEPPAGSYVPGSAHASDAPAKPVEAHDTTGQKVRVFETTGNIARTSAGPRHTSKLFPEGKGGKSLADMGYSDDGGHDVKRGDADKPGGLRDWNEADHPRDEAGKFTNK